MTWVRFWGLPIFVWGREGFEKVVATLGTFVSIDKAICKTTSTYVDCLRCKDCQED